MYQATPNAALNDSILTRIINDAFDRGIDFGTKLVSEASLTFVVMRDGVVQVRSGERVILNSHQAAPPVRRRNSP